MGMSASQARLIALTARMSDVEYEGQQINQQRLELSNKISDIYAQMESMTVPTPPSPQDYMVPVYKGENANGEKISIVNDGQGGFKYYQEMTGDVAKKVGARNKTTGVDIKLAKVEDLPAGQRKEDAYFYPLAEDVKGPGDAGYQELINDYGANGLPEGVSIVGGKIEKKETATGKTVKDANGNDVPEKVTEYKCTGTIHFGTYHVDEAAGLRKAAAPMAANYTEDPSRAITYYLQNGDHVGNKETFESEFYGGFTNEQIASMSEKYYVQTGNGNSVRLLSASDFNDRGKLDGVTLLQKSATGEVYRDSSQGDKSIGGNLVVQNADGSIKKAGDVLKDPEFANNTDLNDAIAGLQHTFPDTWESDFGVILLKDKDGNVSGFQFFRISDYENNDNIEIYARSTGTYKEQIGDSKQYGAPAFDTTGQPKSITINGQTVELSVEKDLDTNAFKSAEVEYTRAKNQYDIEQNALNRKTSTYQLEDKKLDLKLKRLDTERNALNTEIDAVKKVIQDSTEKGFKTFSG